MYELIACDLDGTLLNAEHQLGEETLRVLRALQEQGLEIVLASGRHYRDMLCFAEQLGGTICLISSNGAAVHDRHGQLIASRPLDPDCLDFLLRDALFEAVHINVYRADDWLVDAPEPRLLKYHGASGFAYRVTSLRDIGDKPVLKVFYYHEDVAHLQALEARILERYGDRLSTTYSLPIVLEVMAPGVSKGDALARAVARRGLDAASVIAVGDSRNDFEMLSYAGKGLLMANAVPWLKQALPHLEIIGASTDEAVASYLDALLLRPS